MILVNKDTEVIVFVTKMKAYIHIKQLHRGHISLGLGTIQHNTHEHSVIHLLELTMQYWLNMQI